DGELPVTAWRDAVARAVSRMRDGSVPAKVVLAHDLLAVADEPLDPRYLLHGLAARYPSCWTFAVDQLVGATPELLLRRRGTEVRGTLHPAGPPLLTLADAVHPTAAVGGTPTPAAVSAISELEAMDRGRYAGPVGWVDAAGDGELGIALRCAQVVGRFARLF